MKSKRTLLLIDNDEIPLSIAEYMLMDDYEVVTAKSGQDALDILSKGLAPSLILLDIVMPGMDGWKTYARIRSIDAFHDVPILFLTVLDEVKEKKYALEIGAADYITKPFSRKTLLEKVQSIIKEKYGDN